MLCCHTAPLQGELNNNNRGDVSFTYCTSHVAYERGQNSGVGVWARKLMLCALVNTRASTRLHPRAESRCGWKHREGATTPVARPAQRAEAVRD
jgi:hypothetical protein